MGFAEEGLATRQGPVPRRAFDTAQHEGDTAIDDESQRSALIAIALDYRGDLNDNWTAYAGVVAKHTRENGVYSSLYVSDASGTARGGFLYPPHNDPRCGLDGSTVDF